MIVNKPWGQYEIINTGPGYVIKKITVEIGHKLSLQFHNKRSEFWLIIEGSGQIKWNFDRSEFYHIQNLQAGKSLFIHQGQHHQLINNSDKKLIVLEVQYGECDENDIVRIDDPYKRNEI